MNFKNKKIIIKKSRLENALASFCDNRSHNGQCNEQKCEEEEEVPR
jgi:hypothetical protein